MVTESLANHRPNSKVWHIVVVHDIEMDDVGSGLEDVVDLLSETGEVSGKNGGGDEVVLISPDHVEGGGGTGHGRLQ